MAGYDSFTDFIEKNGFDNTVDLSSAREVQKQYPDMDIERALAVGVAQEIRNNPEETIEKDEIAVNEQSGLAVVTFAEETGENEGNLYHVVFSQWDSTFYVFTETVSIDENGGMNSEMSSSKGWTMDSEYEVAKAFHTISEKYPEIAERAPELYHAERSGDLASETGTLELNGGTDIEFSRSVDKSGEISLSMAFKRVADGDTSAADATLDVDKEIAEDLMERIEPDAVSAPKFGGA